MTLHTFNNQAAFTNFSRFVQAEDQLLFLEEGVYCLQHEMIKKFDAARIYAIKTDILARGLSTTINPGFNQADYSQYVQLCCAADSVCNWS